MPFQPVAKRGLSLRDITATPPAERAALVTPRGLADLIPPADATAYLIVPDKRPYEYAVAAADPVPASVVSEFRPDWLYRAYLVRADRHDLAEFLNEDGVYQPEGCSGPALGWEVVRRILVPQGHLHTAIFGTWAFEYLGAVLQVPCALSTVLLPIPAPPGTEVVLGTGFDPVEIRRSTWTWGPEYQMPPGGKR